MKEVVAKISPTSFRGLFQTVKQLCKDNGSNPNAAVGHLNLSFNQSTYLLNEVYCGKSIFSGQYGRLPKIQLVPWIFEKDTMNDWLTPKNIVCATQGEAKRHMSAGGTKDKNLSLWGTAIASRVEYVLSTIQDSQSDDTNETPHTQSL
eukprot:GHVN01022525.1.p3 GENE.GHVN01022525.1~~GHVN01022525.1.p3  ORF type:complete len:148 (+),score=29.62 GHVN01022525.1:990-1433(+)